MASFVVQKTITIGASAQEVFEKISNFNHWIIWSPWHILEPDSSWQISPDGQNYAWKGKRMGSGNMRITESRPNTYMGYTLQFLKPWKSQSHDYFELKEVEGGTQLTWNMKSKVPFFLFFLKKFMVAAIGMDFVRGLHLLKDYIEQGKVPSQLEFNGITTAPGFAYIGKKSTCTLPQISSIMERNYQELGAYLAAHEGLMAGSPITFYPKMEIVSQKVTFIAAFPVTDIPVELPEGFIGGRIPTLQTWVVTHRGAYRHVSNAWAALSALQRSRVAKFSKKSWPFERYLNNPGNTPEHELITEVHFPLQ